MIHYFQSISKFKLIKTFVEIKSKKLQLYHPLWSLSAKNKIEEWLNLGITKIR